MNEVEKLMVSYNDGKIEIMGNRRGLKFLGEVCLGLSELSDEEAKTAANHYHFEEGLDTSTEAGSIPMIVTLNLKL
jgi:hypothetical protein